ncbi:T9SS type A sorting domain-containing protein [Mucilaginibacter sp. OK098]|uniref:T9SS type A sorting domain-containing protein n=1 Tax=Mucilaginibacter sp. OK098 TaxID=1855297 RepID=UPI0009123FC4|nr:T9SS type A sorting domain-containing protein [Mucilaginibacter sp. OK098]SHN37236.1 Por secretion system C-terminal sorting domain-containing protein [Mucilaginibacter sp. OK098]
MGKFRTICSSGVLKPVLIGLVLLCLSNQSFGVAKLWVGGFLGNGSWNTAGNWSPSGVPTVSDDVTINELLLGFTITLSAASNANSITVNSTIGLLGGVTINTSGQTLTVANSLNVGAVSILLATSLTITGSGAVTLNTAVNAYPAVSLTFSSGTNVTFNSATVTSYDNSTINCNGTVTATSSTFNLTGNNCSIANTGTFNLGTASIIYPTSTTASVTNTSPGIFTLKSNATGSAAIGASSSTVFTGIFNVERFLSGGGLSSNRGYRLLSSPVNQTADAAGTLTTPNTFGLFYLGLHSYGGVNNYPGALTIGIGGSTNGFGLNNNNPTIYFYDESQVYNGRSFTQGNHAPVYAITSTSTGSGVNLITTSKENIGSLTNVNVPVGNGFLMYFVGPSSRTDAWAATPPVDVTMTANGHLNQGTIPVKLWTSATTLSYTTGTAITHPYPGLNMVGNPYPCTIDLHQVLLDNSGINNIYLLSAKNSPNQTYIAYTVNGSSAPSAGYAVSGEGFFVTATGTGTALTFKETEKVPATQLTGAALIMSTPNAQVKGVGGKLSNSQNSLAATEPQNNALTGLYMKIEKDSVTYNYCGIYFRKDWSATFAEDDAKDMNATSGPAIISSLTSDNIRASVNHMPDYTKGVNVKLYANARADGQYKLKIEDIRNIDTLYDIYLIDHYKKDSLDIRRYGTYLFDISKADTSSYGGSRFELSVRPRPLPMYRLLNFTAQKVSGGVQVSWKTEAESNYTGFVLQKQDGTTFNPLYSKQGDGGGIYTFIDPSPVTGANTYRLQQDNIVGAISLSPAITIIYNPAGQAGLMNVYPNPTKATISVSVSTMTSTAPTYKANIYNSAGQLMMQRSVSSNSWTEDVTQYTPGTYIIQLKDNSGNLVGKSKFIKAE